ncbi:MAG: hypothetical protein LBL60_02725 [Mycoplasmataceae bacterium]|nr:hypothetical protein [Mycoplasmataceae bacterium]
MIIINWETVFRDLYDVNNLAKKYDKHKDWIFIIDEVYITRRFFQSLIPSILKEFMHSKIIVFTPCNDSFDSVGRPQTKINIFENDNEIFDISQISQFYQDLPKNKFFNKSMIEIFMKVDRAVERGDATLFLISSISEDKHKNFSIYRYISSFLFWLLFSGKFLPTWKNFIYFRDNVLHYSWSSKIKNEFFNECIDNLISFNLFLKIDVDESFYGCNYILIPYVSNSMLVTNYPFCERKDVWFLIKVIKRMLNAGQKVLFCMKNFNNDKDKQLSNDYYIKNFFI